MRDWLRWKLWGLVIKSRRVCPANAHGALIWRTRPLGEITVDWACRRDFTANGACWCGNLRADRLDGQAAEQAAGSSTSAYMIVSGAYGIPQAACPPAATGASPVSQADYYSGLVVSNGTWQPGRGVPPPLDAIGPDVMLAVAAVRGPEPWQWREAAPDAYMAWPDAIGAIHAEEMTAAQLRAILATRDGMWFWRRWLCGATRRGSRRRMRCGWSGSAR